MRGNRRLKKGPVPIREVVLELSERLGKGASKQKAIDSLWEKTIGKKKNRHTRIGALERGVLTIVVDNASALYELSLERGIILQKLQKSLGENYIKDLRFQIGLVQSSPSAK